MGRIILVKKRLNSDICDQQPTKNVLDTAYPPRLSLDTHVLLRDADKHVGLWETSAGNLSLF